MSATPNVSQDSWRAIRSLAALACAVAVLSACGGDVSQDLAEVQAELAKAKAELNRLEESAGISEKASIVVSDLIRTLDSVQVAPQPVTTTTESPEEIEARLVDPSIEFPDTWVVEKRASEMKVFDFGFTAPPRLPLEVSTSTPETCRVGPVRLENLRSVVTTTVRAAGRCQIDIVSEQTYSYRATTTSFEFWIPDSSDAENFESTTTSSEAAESVD